ncbi:MAG: hypothetical protein RL272_133 [Candidatus Parcubacteria bacterium]|jgi:phosphatidylinositol alpha-1,6-mannosyltransferase
MKTVVLATLEYPPQTGGVATYLANVVACFPKGSIHVLAPEGGDTHAADMRSDAPIYRRRLLGKWVRPRWLSALYWTDWLLRKERADMLLVSHLLPMGRAARIIKKWRGIPYAVIVHGMDVALALEAGGAKRATAKAVLEDAEFVVANSAFTAHLAETAGAKKDRIMLVRPSPGFPPYMTVPQGRLEVVRQFYALGGGFRLLSVGRLVERKGFTEAIEAVALLKERGRDVSLAIVGDGPERRQLEEFAKSEGVADLVTFTGKVPDHDLPALYSLCDAFVMAPRSIGSDVEGFGIVYLEAHLMGKPVIGSRAGGVPDAVLDGKTGLLVNPGDPDAIAKAVITLMDDPALWERLGQAGRERVLHEFGWKLQAAPLVAALLAGKP